MMSARGNGRDQSGRLGIGTEQGVGAGVQRLREMRAIVLDVPDRIVDRPDFQGLVGAGLEKRKPSLLRQRRSRGADDSAGREFQPPGRPC
jgi:hypothetical protein